MNDLISKKYGKSTLVNDVVFSVIALLLVCFCFFTTQFWLSICKVQGDSMYPTLKNNDVLIMNRLSKVERGDIIVFEHHETSLIKRVIALEGEKVKCQDGQIFITKIKNGVETTFILEEPYLKDVKTPNFAETIVRKGEVFVLGDNRTNSSDSSNFGPISKSSIKGVVHNFFIKNKNTITKIFG